MFDNENKKYVRLESKVCVKYLGALVDQNFSWKYHIDSIVTKISKNVELLAKLRQSVPRPILLNIYKSLIHPYLTYGLAAWGQTCKTYLNKILILQKRALRLLYLAGWHDHAIPLILETKKTKQFFLSARSKAVNKIKSFLTDLPKKAFKKVLCKLLFDILEKEDDYIQIPVIIKKVGTLAKGLNACPSFSVLSFRSQ